MEDTYFKILKHLEPFGVNRDVEIGYLLYGLFAKQIAVDKGEHIDSINGRIERFCDEVLDEKMHVLHKKQKENVSGKTQWRIQARLTLAGLDYYYTDILRKATLSSYKNQKWVTRWTLFISIVSIAVSVHFGLKSNLLESQVGALQKRLDTIEKTTNKTIYRTPKVLDPVKKISLKNNVTY